jgi:lysophospholipase L1-like esterase
MKYIKDTSRMKLQHLSKEDVVVLCGGCNDIAKNNSTVGMKHLLEFVINTNHTNVILMSAPHRYDLMRNSCVNNEIYKFNMTPHIRLEKLGKVEMTDVVSDRNLNTRYEQHLNSEGKENMAKKIASTIEHVLNKKVEPISGKWYTDKETYFRPPASAGKDRQQP